MTGVFSDTFMFGCLAYDHLDLDPQAPTTAYAARLSAAMIDNDTARLLDAVNSRPQTP